MKYFEIRFDDPPIRIDESKLKRKFWNGFAWILKQLLPSANPDFEEKIKEVVYYWIESNDQGIPKREIGFNKNQSPIVLGPYDENYGVIVDSNSIFEDFENSKEIEIRFDGLWNQLSEKLETKPTANKAVGVNFE